MQNNLNNKLDKILYKLANCTVGAVSKRAVTGAELWPFHPDHLKLFFIKDWFDRLLYLLRKLENEGYKDEFIASLFKSSSRIANIFYHFDSIKETRLNKSEKIYIFKKLYQLLSIFRKNPEKTIIWNDDVIKSIEKSTKFINLRKKINLKQDIYSLEAILLLYTELVWFMYHPLGHSFHGPYKIDNKGLLVVRKYFDLKIMDVWGFTKFLHFREIKILEIYKKIKGLEIDFLERGFKPTIDYRSKLIGVSIKVDNKPVYTKKEIIKIINNLNEVIERGGRFIQSLTQQELFIKHIKCWFYILKPLSDVLKLDWHPPQKVYNNVYNLWEKVEKNWIKISKIQEKETNLSHKEKVEELKKHFDPR